MVVSIAYSNGCEMGPKYRYAQQPDSVFLMDGEAPSIRMSDVVDEVYVEKIDGLAAPTAQVLGIGSTTNQNFLAPGKHVLYLFLRHSNPDYSGGRTGFSVVMATGIIDFVFLAYHKYRITAAVGGESIHVTLWDETNGIDTRVDVGEWTFVGQRQYEPV